MLHSPSKPTQYGSKHTAARKKAGAAGRTAGVDCLRCSSFIPAPIACLYSCAIKPFREAALFQELFFQGPQLLIE